MNLFELICRNSRYYLGEQLSVEDKKKKYRELGCAFNKQYFAFVESLVPSFVCPLDIIEQFLGEPYDFTKHIKPLINEKLIWIRAYQNCFPHSKELESKSRAAHGIVGDYKTHTKYLQFYLGPEDPNKNKNLNSAWI